MSTTAQQRSPGTGAWHYGLEKAQLIQRYLDFELPMLPNAEFKLAQPIPHVSNMVLSILEQGGRICAES